MGIKSKVTRIRIDPETESAVNAFIESEPSIKNISDLIRTGIGFILNSDQPQLSREMVDQFEAWRKEFHGVGSNLNQIAYKMNANHPLSSEEIESTLEELRLHFKKLAQNMRNMKRDLFL